MSYLLLYIVSYFISRTLFFAANATRFGMRIDGDGDKALLRVLIISPIIGELFLLIFVVAITGLILYECMDNLMRMVENMVGRRGQ